MSANFGIFNIFFSMGALLAVLHISIRESGGEVYSSQWDILSLQHSEDEMVELVEKYLESEEKRLQNIQRLLEERLDREYTGPSHPVNSYHLINFWRRINRTMADQSSIFEFKRNYERLSQPIIDDEDYKGAMRGLLRLQKVYNLSTKSLSQGRVLGRPSSPLGVVDCYMLGIQARGMDEFGLAIEWLTVALDSCCDPEILALDKPWLHMDIAESYFMAEDYEEAVKHSKQVKIKRGDPRGKEFLGKIRKFRDHHERLPSNKTRALGRDVTTYLQRYAQLCRGDIPQTAYQRPEIQCRLKNPYNYYSWIKEEILNIDPWISILYDLVTDRETRELKELALTRFERGQIKKTNSSGTESDMRIAKIAWLYEDYLPTDVGVRLSERIGRVTGLSTTVRYINTSAEDLQVCNYGIGGQYEPHLDTFHDFDLSRFPPQLVNSGDRIATVMLYLNNVAAGGSTVFTNLNITVKPVKNAALFWYNLKRSGHWDNNTYHAGCPVILGGKWVANKWIHELGQEFRRPCGTHINATDLEV